MYISVQGNRVQGPIRGAVTDVALEGARFCDGAGTCAVDVTNEDGLTRAIHCLLSLRMHQPTALMELPVPLRVRAAVKILSA